MPKPNRKRLVFARIRKLEEELNNLRDSLFLENDNYAQANNVASSRNSKSPVIQDWSRYVSQSGDKVSIGSDDPSSSISAHDSRSKYESRFEKDPQTFARDFKSGYNSKAYRPSKNRVKPEEKDMFYFLNERVKKSSNNKMTSSSTSTRNLNTITNDSESKNYSDVMSILGELNAKLSSNVTDTPGFNILAEIKKLEKLKEEPCLKYESTFEKDPHLFLRYFKSGDNSKAYSKDRVKPVEKDTFYFLNERVEKSSNNEMTSSSTSSKNLNTKANVSKSKNSSDVMSIVGELNAKLSSNVTDTSGFNIPAEIKKLEKLKEELTKKHPPATASAFIEQTNTRPDTQGQQFSFAFSKFISKSVKKHKKLLPKNNLLFEGKTNESSKQFRNEKKEVDLISEKLGTKVKAPQAHTKRVIYTSSQKTEVSPASKRRRCSPSPSTRKRQSPSPVPHRKRESISPHRKCVSGSPPRRRDKQSPSSKRDSSPTHSRQNSPSPSRIRPTSPSRKRHSPSPSTRKGRSPSPVPYRKRESIPPRRKRVSGSAPRTGDKQSPSSKRDSSPTHKKRNSPSPSRISPTLPIRKRRSPSPSTRKRRSPSPLPHRKCESISPRRKCVSGYPPRRGDTQSPSNKRESSPTHKRRNSPSPSGIRPTSPSSKRHSTSPSTRKRRSPSPLPHRKRESIPTHRECVSRSPPRRGDKWSPSSKRESSPVHKRRNSPSPSRTRPTSPSRKIHSTSPSTRKRRSRSPVPYRKRESISPLRRWDSESSPKRRDSDSPSRKRGEPDNSRKSPKHRQSRSRSPRKDYHPPQFTSPPDSSVPPYQGHPSSSQIYPHYQPLPISGPLPTVEDPPSNLEPGSHPNVMISSPIVGPLGIPQLGSHVGHYRPHQFTGSPDSSIPPYNGYPSSSQLYPPPYHGYPSNSQFYLPYQPLPIARPLSTVELPASNVEPEPHSNVMISSPIVGPPCIPRPGIGSHVSHHCSHQFTGPPDSSVSPYNGYPSSSQFYPPYQPLPTVRGPPSNVRPRPNVIILSPIVGPPGIQNQGPGVGQSVVPPTRPQPPHGTVPSSSNMDTEIPAISSASTVNNISSHKSDVYLGTSEDEKNEPYVVSNLKCDNLHYKCQTCQRCFKKLKKLKNHMHIHRLESNIDKVRQQRYLLTNRNLKTWMMAPRWYLPMPTINSGQCSLASSQDTEIPAISSASTVNNISSHKSDVYFGTSGGKKKKPSAVSNPKCDYLRLQCITCQCSFESKIKLSDHMYCHRIKSSIDKGRQKWRLLKQHRR